MYRAQARSETNRLAAKARLAALNALPGPSSKKAKAEPSLQQMVFNTIQLADAAKLEIKLRKTQEAQNAADTMRREQQRRVDETEALTRKKDAHAAEMETFDWQMSRLAALDRTIADLQEARTALRRLAGACASTDSGPCPIIAAFQGEAS